MNVNNMRRVVINQLWRKKVDTLFNISLRVNQQQLNTLYNQFLNENTPLSHKVLYDLYGYHDNPTIIINPKVCMFVFDFPANENCKQYTCISSWSIQRTSRPNIFRFSS